VKNNQRPKRPWHIEPDVLNTVLDEEFSNDSIFTPALKNWAEDLTDNNGQQQTAPRLTWVNKINDIWMEVPCYASIMWWGAWVVLIMISISLLVILWVFFQPSIF